MSYFKSAIQPLCRYCGNPIKKVTETVRFGCSERAHERDRRNRVERPANKAEAQRYVNGLVVSVRRSTQAQINYAGGTGSSTIEVPSYVSEVGAWDGETYWDEFFCSNSCARSFGYVCARAGDATETYNAAIRARKG